MLDLALKMLLGDKAKYIMLISGLTFLQTRWPGWIRGVANQREGRQKAHTRSTLSAHMNMHNDVSTPAVVARLPISVERCLIAPPH